MSNQIIDKSKWPRGEWDNEPDYVFFIDEDTGLRCDIMRNKTMGHLCGYVGVTKDHPLYGKEYFEEKELDLDCHGGVTFSGLKDDIWWFGFDCAHANDIHPLTSDLWDEVSEASYKNIDYVKCHIKKLAKQLYSLGQTKHDA